MSTQERIDYEAHLKNLAISRSMLETAKMEGEHEGEIRGEMSGEKRGLIVGAYNKAKQAGAKLILRGFSNEDITDITGLTYEEIETLRKEMN